MQRGIVGNNTKRKLDVNEFRGFAISDNYAPLVFINARDATAAKNFTIVHELCHIWIGKSGISNPNLRNRSSAEISAEERFCNAVAAEVLAPRDDVGRLWNRHEGLDTLIAQLARYFRVSRYVVARQAFEMDRISYDQYIAYLERNPKFLKASQTEEESRGNFYNTFSARNGKKFIAGVLTALSQNRISYRNAADYLNVKIATLKKVAERFR